MDAQQSIQSLTNKIDLVKNANSIDSLRGIEGSSQAVYFSVYTKLYPYSYGFSLSC
jgi:CRISPR/Cas system-associated endonuclease Cas1